MKSSMSPTVKNGMNDQHARFHVAIKKQIIYT